MRSSFIVFYSLIVGLFAFMAPAVAAPYPAMTVLELQDIVTAIDASQPVISFEVSNSTDTINLAASDRCMVANSKSITNGEHCQPEITNISFVIIEAGTSEQARAPPRTL